MFDKLFYLVVPRDKLKFVGHSFLTDLLPSTEVGFICRCQRQW
jgi:hypothetical protein